MDAGMTLVKSSPKTRSWVRILRDRLPHFEYSETQEWATFKSKPDTINIKKGRPLGDLRPTKQRIDLRLPLDPSDDPHLQPTSSTQRWADTFRSVFKIANEDDLSTATRLITKAYERLERGMSRLLIDVESQELRDEEIDLAIRENRLRLGMVPTDNALALTRQRRGQDRLKELTLMSYGSMCALCDINDPSLLIASHIVGWAKAPEARGMLSNVICLCRFHDVLFELGYWSLADNFTILKKSQPRSHIIAYLLDSSIQFRKPHSHPPASGFLHQHRLRWGLGVATR